jgi:signal transduction histidine kinase
MEPQELTPTLRALADEFEPLAARRNQRISIEADAELSWRLPLAAIEAVLGNVLMNAIQHGAPGAIRIVLDGSGIALHNRCELDDARSGFGLGLELARRLLARIGWVLQLERSDGDQICVRLAAAPSPPVDPDC